jgi:penicillin-binding protein 2
MYLVANDPNGSAYSTFGGYSHKVAAKTGTAQTGADITANGMFICYAPFDDPQIAIAIAVDHAGAGKSLGPIAKDILDAYFSSQSAQDNTEEELTILK